MPLKRPLDFCKRMEQKVNIILKKSEVMDIFHAWAGHRKT